MKFFIAGIILMLSLKFFAQGTELEFSQVHYLKFSASTLTSNYILKDTTIVVPPGKVWKIERASAQWNSGTAQNQLNVPGAFTPSASIYIDLNAVRISNFVWGYTIGNNLPTFPEESNPVWLEPGTYVFRMMKTESDSVTGNANGFISAIEFNLN